MFTLHRRSLTVAALLVSSAAILHATGPAIPRWPYDFTYLGRTVLASAPYPKDWSGTPVGDFRYGKALALKPEAGGAIGIYVGSWNPQAVLYWRTQPSLSGTFGSNATFMRSLGTGLYVQGELFGLYWDREDNQDVLLGSFNNTYDHDLATAITLSRAVVDPATGLLSSRGAFKYANRSDKMTQGGITAVPTWWRQQYRNCRLLAGWGGYWSIISFGPVSMGPSAACFNPPEPLSGANTTISVPNTPVIGFPFSDSKTVQTPATRRADYNYDQTYGWGWWPETVPAGTMGYWNPGDLLWQGCAWVDTPAVSGLVCMPVLQEGCNWYGSNAQPPVPPVCSPNYAGYPATLNSQHSAHWAFIYDPHALGRVALGLAPQTSVQPVQQARVQFPGISYPLAGMPYEPRMIAGVAYEPTRHLFAVLVRDTRSTSGRPTIFWYRVRAS